MTSDPFGKFIEVNNKSKPVRTLRQTKAFRDEVLFDCVVVRCFSCSLVASLFSLFFVLIFRVLSLFRVYRFVYNKLDYDY